MRMYTEKQVIDIAKEAVCLWRKDHDARLYRSVDYFGKWITDKLQETKSVDADVLPRVKAYLENPTEEERIELLNKLKSQIATS